MNNQIDYEKALLEQLHGSRLNLRQITAIMRTFSENERIYGAERAFAVCHENYLDGDTNKLLTKMQANASIYCADEIQKRLEEFSKNTIENNPLLRVRKAISRLRANLDLFGNAEVTNHRGTFTILDDEDLKQVKSFWTQDEQRKESAYTAWGTIRDKYC